MARDETKFLFLSPALASADVPRDIVWYEERLGFKNVYDSSQYQEGKIDYAVLGRQHLLTPRRLFRITNVSSDEMQFSANNILI